MPKEPKCHHLHPNQWLPRTPKGILVRPGAAASIGWSPASFREWPPVRRFAAVQSAGEDAAGTFWVAGQNGALAPVRPVVRLQYQIARRAAVCVAVEADGVLSHPTKALSAINGAAAAGVESPTNLAIRSLYPSATGEPGSAPPPWRAINCGRPETLPAARRRQ
jgi:hypothetical protein